jgi:hypothetical protein
MLVLKPSPSRAARAAFLIAIASLAVCLLMGRGLAVYLGSLLRGHRLECVVEGE